MNKIVDLEQIKKENAVYIENIQDGFNNYLNIILEGSEEEVNNAIRQLFKYNGIDSSYADFYYGRLDQDAKNKVRSALDEKEILLIESLHLSSNDIFVRLDNELLEILLKLTASEVLFSSFYFTKHPCTVWGNYDRKYPVFFENQDVMKIVTEQVWNK